MFIGYNGTKTGIRYRNWKCTRRFIIQSQYLCGMKAVLARQVSWSQYKNVTPEFTFHRTDNQDFAYLKSNQ